MSAPIIAYIALGSNLDQPAAQVKRGFAELHALARTRLTRRSPLYRTKPVGYADQPDFVNAIAEIETCLSPDELLDASLEIERKHGRNRTFKNAPRTLDLDILLYGNMVSAEPRLTLPHPRMHERAFVLVPLAEIAPDCMIPGRGRVADLVKSIGAETPPQRIED